VAISVGEESAGQVAGARGSSAKPRRGFRSRARASSPPPLPWLIRPDPPQASRQKTDKARFGPVGVRCRVLNEETNDPGPRTRLSAVTRAGNRSVHPAPHFLLARSRSGSQKDWRDKGTLAGWGDCSEAGNGPSGAKRSEALRLLHDSAPERIVRPPRCAAAATGNKLVGHRLGGDAARRNRQH